MEMVKHPSNGGQGMTMLQALEAWKKAKEAGQADIWNEKAAKLGQ